LEFSVYLRLVSGEDVYEIYVSVFFSYPFQLNIKLRDLFY
jgi:hypothetical protein